MRQHELNPAYGVTTAPTLAVLSADELHTQLRIDFDDEDPLLDRYIATATELVETDSRLWLRPAELTLHLDDWPRCGPVLIQRGPVNAIDAVRYIDADGDQQTWSDWRADLVSRPARLDRAYGVSWPVIRQQTGAIEIDLDVGYAEGAAPEAALQMVRLLVSHWYLQREAVGRVTREVEFSYHALLDRLAY